MKHGHWLLMLLSCTLMLAAPACKRDKCKRVTCVNGTCVDGTCECSTGYFGEDCSLVINAGYEGAWSLTENCTAGEDYYEVAIAPVAASKVAIIMLGIWEQQDSLVGEFLADGHSFTVAKQRVGSVEIAGDGTTNEFLDEITLHYNVYNPGSSQAFDVCTATLTKN